jgi:hypothetical protein
MKSKSRLKIKFRYHIQIYLCGLFLLSVVTKILSQTINRSVGLTKKMASTLTNNFVTWHGYEVISRDNIHLTSRFCRIELCLTLNLKWYRSLFKIRWTTCYWIFHYHITYHLHINITHHLHIKLNSVGCEVCVKKPHIRCDLIWTWIYKLTQ